MGKTYFTNDSLRIFYNGKDEIRFKLGLWNYNEAVLNINKETEGFKETFLEILNDLRSGHRVTEKDINNSQISNDIKLKIINILDGLSKAGMLITEDQKNLSNELNMALLGDYSYVLRTELKREKPRKLLFITDNSYSEKIAKLLIEDMELNIDIAKEEFIDFLRDIDLTTNIDALSTLSNMEKVIFDLKEYEGIILCFKRPELTLLRNINRIAIKEDKPIICSFIDGPFITVLSTNYPKTGCIECFEQRTLTRLEDHISYNAFENFKFRKETKDMNRGVIPLINMLTNLVFSEGFLLSNYGTSKFENRVLNIYVPTLEIQVQDLLRVPYCPACGNLSKAKFQELNISSRRVVDNILDELT